MKTMLTIYAILMSFIGTAFAQGNEKGYERIEKFKNGRALVHRDGMVGIIDQDGHEIVSPKYDFIGKFNKRGWAEVRLNGSMGFINWEGVETVCVKFDRIEKFNRRGYAKVYKDGKQGLIDEDGKEIISIN